MSVGTNSLGYSNLKVDREVIKKKSKMEICRL